MHIDRAAAQAAFAAYVSAYDPQNPRIALKLAHSYRVASLAERIAASRGAGNPQLSRQDTDLAWLIGLMHDIGRFEQVRRFDTFIDAISLGHAALGVHVLMDEDAGGDPLIRRFVQGEDEDALIACAIACHSDLVLPRSLDARTRTFAEILRDADKLDIIRVNVCCPIEDIYGVSERAMYESQLSGAVVETFYQMRTLPRSIRTYPADILVSHICFAWELVFERSRELVLEQGYLDQMLARHFEREETERTFQEMSSFMRTRLSRGI